jgi:hypothetical protein
VKRSSRPLAARRGLTLYEVVLAIAILLPAVAVLSQGLNAGSRAASSTRLQTEAVLRCDSLMSEVVAGVVPMTAVTDSAFDDGEPGWTWTLEIGTGPHPDLLAIQVTVQHAAGDGTVNAMASMGRFTRDPQIFIDAALAAPINSGTGTGSTASGTTGGTSTGGTSTGRTNTGTGTGGTR